jgi:hypothetical protein
MTPAFLAWRASSWASPVQLIRQGGNREFIDRPPNSNGRQDRGSLLLRAIL